MRPDPRKPSPRTPLRLGPFILFRTVLLVLMAVFAWRTLVAQDVTPTGLSFSSTAFGNDGAIPDLYTCTGRDISPPLNWGELPAGTRSLALIVDNPDAPAPTRPWVHWILFNIPPSATGLPEGVTGPDLPVGAVQGLNDWKRARYNGPCPPAGRYRYFHKLYALDTVLTDLGTPTRATLERAMQGHILGRAQLVGTYERP